MMETKKKKDRLRIFDSLLKAIAKTRAGKSYETQWPEAELRNIKGMSSRKAKVFYRYLINLAQECQIEISRNHDLRYNVGFRDALLDVAEDYAQWCEKKTKNGDESFELDVPVWVNRDDAA